MRISEFRSRAAGPADEKSSEKWVNFAVREEVQLDWVGRIEATVHDGWAEVAYLLGHQYWGRGDAAEAVDWLHRYLRRTYSVSQVWAAVDPRNARSIRLLTRLGYVSVEQSAARELMSFVPGDRLFKREL